MYNDQTQKTHFLNEISIVIVLYNTLLEDCLSLKSLIENLDSMLFKTKCHLVIYDNSLVESTNRNFTNKYFDITYIHDSSNPGISKAYNESTLLASQLNKKWVLFLDDDTVLDSNSLLSYFKSVKEYPQQDIFVPILFTSSNGIQITPSKYYFKRGFLWKNYSIGINKFSNRTFINSGIMIRIETFFESGGYDERVSLYFSDYCFVEKLSTKYKTFVVTNAKGLHNMNIINGKSLNTFSLYCKGVFQFANVQTNFISKYILILSCLMRAGKLLFKYKKKEYLSIFWQNFHN